MNKHIGEMQATKNSDEHDNDNYADNEPEMSEGSRSSRSIGAMFMNPDIQMNTNA